MGWQGSALKTVFSMMILLPPTFLMGMTLPLLISTVVSTQPEHSKRELLLYAANTLGGVLGLGVVVLVSVQALGQAGSMLLMIGLNLSIALRCYLRGRLGDTQNNQAGSTKADSSADPWSIEKLPLVLAFFSGAGVLSLEVLGLALANLSAPLSFYPQGSILMCVILLLAVAAWLVAKIGTRPGMPLRVAPVSMAATCAAAAFAPAVFYHLPGVENGLFGYGRSFGGFLATLVGLSLVSLGPAFLCAGMLFPAVAVWPNRGRNIPGRQLGLLLAANGLGGVIGAEIAYRLLLPNFAVHVSMGIVGVCYGLFSLGLASFHGERSIRRIVWSSTTLLLACYLTGTALVNLPVYYEEKLYKVVDMLVGREGSLAVVEDSRPNRVMIFDNQYTLGGTVETPGLRRQSHLPLLLHPAPARIGFIGLGTGITASGALEHRAVQSITAVELSPLVVEAAASDFDQFNHGICHNPKVKIHVEDARIYLEAAKDSFDVVVGDLFTPWRPGEASLSSLEQFRAAHKALHSGGVFCQWIELTQWTPEQFEIAAATFRKVFGHLYLFRTGFETRHIPLGLVGFKDGAPDWSVVARRCAFEAQNGQLQDPLCRHPEGVAMLYLGEFIPPSESKSQINTLNNLRIELSASRQVVLIDAGTHFSGTGEHWLRMLDEQSAAAARMEAMPDSLRSYPKLGALATRFEFALEAKSPTAKEIAERLMDGLPLAVRGDSAANWTLWPGSAAPWEFLGLRGSSSSTESHRNGSQ